MYYSSFGSLAIVIHLIINAEALRPYKDEAPDMSKVAYRRFLWTVMLYYLADILWGILYETRIVPLVYADTVLYFVSMSLTLLFWMKFIAEFLNEPGIFSRILINSGWGFFVLQSAALLTNFFCPIFFSFNESKVYQPGWIRYVFLGGQIFLFVLTAIQTMISALHTTGKERLHYKTICISSVTMTIFIILQTWDPLLPFYAVGCLLATCLMHSFVKVSERDDYIAALKDAKKLLYKDALTSVHNKKAYMEKINETNQRISSGELSDFGIVVFDLNNLKYVNDTYGHDVGDRYIRAGAHLICNTFKHSPVFRIGGDEFVAILEGDDYTNRNELLAGFERQIDKNQSENAVVVASGMDILDPDRDTSFDELFERADHIMYARKNELKKKQTL